MKTLNDFLNSPFGNSHPDKGSTSGWWRDANKQVKGTCTNGNYERLFG